MLPTFIRFKELKARNVVGSWPQLRDLQERSGFPLGRLIGAVRCWTETEIAEWLESRPVEPMSLRGNAKAQSEAKKAREAEHEAA